MASNASAKPRRLAATPLPDARITSSKTARGIGKAALAATAPSSTALMAVPACCARAWKSSSSAARAWRCSTATSAAASWRPSPICIFSATVSMRLVALITSVRSRWAMPLPIWRTVSSSSDDSSRSISPGTGFRLNTGRRPCRLLASAGQTST